MDDREISSDEAGQLLDRLMKKSIPVLAVLLSESGAVSHVYGFVDSITAKSGLIVSSTQQMPSMSSYIAAPIGNPAGAGCRFSLENAPNERLELTYGDSALNVRLPSGARLTIFFTSKT